jgi:tetratricopeptide (TPR) repeat protein
MAQPQIIKLIWRLDFDVSYAYLDKRGSALNAMSNTVPNFWDTVGDGTVHSSYVGTATKSGALGNIGFAHMSLGQLGEAESFFAQALQISERVGDADLHARQLASLGNLMEMKGNEARASEYYELAMQRYQGSEKVADRVKVLANLARLSRNRADADAARHYYDEALRAARAAHLDDLADEMAAAIAESQSGSRPQGVADTH